MAAPAADWSRGRRDKKSTVARATRSEEIERCGLIKIFSSRWRRDEGPSGHKSVQGSSRRGCEEEEVLCGGEGQGVTRDDDGGIN
jgi:hypothetical protein